MPSSPGGGEHSPLWHVFAIIPLPNKEAEYASNLPVETGADAEALVDSGLAAEVSGATAGCPNSNWTGVNPVLTLTTISLTIEQPPGTTIFSCGASAANGLTSPVKLTC